jgi:hypothetical protein
MKRVIPPTVAHFIDKNEPYLATEEHNIRNTMHLACAGGTLRARRVIGIPILFAAMGLR